jgi:hypothetical protein
LNQEVQKLGSEKMIGSEKEELKIIFIHKIKIKKRGEINPPFSNI